MTALVVVGTQWGDEGKGKIVDLLTEQADAVVRYQGGNNAGHTVMFGDETHILHLIPSGILRDTMSILGNGVVIDLPELLKEIEELRENGVEVQGKLHVSARSHLVMPWHRLIDQLREKDKGEKKIGTTGRGIGPAYEDKVGRRGVRNPPHRPGLAGNPKTAQTQPGWPVEQCRFPRGSFSGNERGLLRSALNLPKFSRMPSASGGFQHPLISFQLFRIFERYRFRKG